MHHVRPAITGLRCPTCGQHVIIEYYPDKGFDTVPEPLWHCPHEVCALDAPHPLIGARQIVSVKVAPQEPQRVNWPSAGEPTTLAVDCAACSRPVTLLMSEWPVVLDHASRVVAAHPAEPHWMCPWCSRPNHHGFPGQLTFAMKRHP